MLMYIITGLSTTGNRITLAYSCYHEGMHDMLTNHGVLMPLLEGTVYHECRLPAA